MLIFSWGGVKDEDPKKLKKNVEVLYTNANMF